MENIEVKQSPTMVSADRQKALADGVFAIVMTLLVLELAVPVIHEASNQELTHALFSMWPKFLSYVLSFLILGVYWLIHHFIFDNIRHYDPTLAWLNVLFLLFVALIPFSTSLLGEYFLEKTSTVVYGIQLLVMFFMGFSTWSYATGKKHLIDPNIDNSLVKGAKRMGYLYFLILVIGTVLGFFIPIVSIIIYGLVVVLFIVFTGIGRTEYVITIPEPGKTKVE